MQTIISHVELTSADARILWKRLMAVIVFLLIATSMMIVFTSVADFSFSDSETYVFLGFGVFFFSIIFYMAFGIVRDLFKGEKKIITGVVTDKKTHKSSKSRGGYRGGSRGRSGRRGGSSSSPKHYLYFGDEKFYVEHRHYNEAIVGRKIELHYAPHASASLRVVELSDNGVPLESERKKTFNERILERRELLEAIPVKETGMTQADRTLLRKSRNRAMRLNLWFVVMGFFMLIAFSIGALLWWVMTFPVVFLLVWVVYFTRKSIKTQRLYRLDSDSGIKVLYKTRILDKQHHSGSGSGYMVETELGIHNVSKYTYEILEGQEDAIVSLAKHSGWLIDIQTKSLEEFQTEIGHLPY